MKHGQGRYRYDMVGLGSNTVKFKHGEARPTLKCFRSGCEDCIERTPKQIRRDAGTRNPWGLEIQRRPKGGKWWCYSSFVGVSGCHGNVYNIDVSWCHALMIYISRMMYLSMSQFRACQVGNHNYGQLLDFSLLDENEFSERSVNLSNYAELKARMAERCGMHVRILRFSETVSEAQLITIIQGADLAALSLFFVLNLLGLQIIVSLEMFCDLI